MEKATAISCLILRQAHQEVDPIEHPVIAGMVRRAFERLDMETFEEEDD